MIKSLKIGFYVFISKWGIWIKTNKKRRGEWGAVAVEVGNMGLMGKRNKKKRKKKRKRRKEKGKKWGIRV